MRAVTKNRPARLAGVLFVLSGALVIVNNYLPAVDHLDRGLLAWIGTSAILAGFVVWWLIPWDRLPRAATLALPALGLGLIGLANAAGGVSPHSYSAFFILVAAYIGATQRRWTTALFSLPMAAVYVGALLYRGDAGAAIWSVTVVVPVCILVGEVVGKALADLEASRARSERRAELLAVAVTAAKSVSSLDPDRVLEAIADGAQALGYEGVAVEMLDRRNRTYRCVEARGLPSAFVGQRQPSETGVTGEVLRRQAQTVIENYDSDERAPSPLRGLGFRLVIGTPMWRDGQVVGVLKVATRRSVLVEASELECLELLAEQAGHALQLADDYAKQGRERRRFMRESLVDQLSGIGNRRQAEQLLQRAATGDALVMLDLDNFKRLNDTQGHARGDDVIAQLGRFLRTTMRRGDEAARFGGEEFMLVLRAPGARLGAALERLRLDWNARSPLTTFTVGAASIEEGESPRDALARADRALLRAKAAGKDRVLIAERNVVRDPAVISA